MIPCERYLSKVHPNMPGAKGGDKGRLLHSKPGKPRLLPHAAKSVCAPAAHVTAGGGPKDGGGGGKGGGGKSGGGSGRTLMTKDAAARIQVGLPPTAHGVFSTMAIGFLTNISPRTIVCMAHLCAERRGSPAWRPGGEGLLRLPRPGVQVHARVVSKPVQLGRSLLGVT